MIPPKIDNRGQTTQIGAYSTLTHYTIVHLDMFIANRMCLATKAFVSMGAWTVHSVGIHSDICSWLTYYYLDSLCMCLSLSFLVYGILEGS